MLADPCSPEEIQPTSWIIDVVISLPGFSCSVISTCVHAKLLQSSPTLYNPVDHSLPGSSVQGILQARILEWVVISYARGSPRSRGRTHTPFIVCIGRQVLLPLAPPVKPIYIHSTTISTWWVLPSIFPKTSLLSRMFILFSESQREILKIPVPQMCLYPRK